MECLQWEADGSLPEPRYLVSFEKETFFQTILFALTVIFLLENILSTFPWEGALPHP